MKEIEITNKVNLIERELFSLKLLLLSLSKRKKRQQSALEGALKDLDVTEEDIKNSKLSLFRY